jgi:hypothetical protein
MLLSIFRVLLGFALACLLAGTAQVMFALTPAAVLNGSSREQAQALEVILLAATHSAVFAAPFALIGAAIGEWQSLRSLSYYAIVGLAIAIGGFLAVYQSEPQGAASIVNSYAMAAYGVSGLLAGIAYWLIAGRHAGDDVIGDGPQIGRDRRRTPPAPPISRAT